MFDRDGSGTINFNEFVSLWRCITDWQNCFRSFDRNNSGTIDRWEFKNALTQLGYQICDDTLSSHMQEYGHCGSNNIYLDGFIHCCISLHVSAKTISLVEISFWIFVWKYLIMGSNFCFRIQSTFTEGTTIMNLDVLTHMHITQVLIMGSNLKIRF